MRHANEKCRAFTLVELLVVVGIIAVLIAFLLPSLRRARDQAHLVACLSNIRQCAMVAIGMYANDNRGQVTPLLCVRSGFQGTGYHIYGPAGGWTVRDDNYPPGNPYNVNFADLIQPYFNSNNQRDNPNFTQYSAPLYCAADEAGMEGYAPWSQGRVGWWGLLYYREFS